MNAETTIGAEVWLNFTPLRPLRDDVLIVPESKEENAKRLSPILAIVDGDDALRGGFTETTFRARVVAIGPRVKDRALLGRMVLMPSVRDFEKWELKDGVNVLYVFEERVIIAVLDDEDALPDTLPALPVAPPSDGTPSFPRRGEP